MERRAGESTEIQLHSYEIALKWYRTALEACEKKVESCEEEISILVRQNVVLEQGLEVKEAEIANWGTRVTELAIIKESLEEKIGRHEDYAKELEKKITDLKNKLRCQSELVDTNHRLRSELACKSDGQCLGICWLLIMYHVEIRIDGIVFAVWMNQVP